MATGRSEYGGDGGLIQPEEVRSDGSGGHRVGPGAADKRGIQEEAMLLRMHGAREREGLPPLSDEELREVLNTRAWNDRQ